MTKTMMENLTSGLAILNGYREQHKLDPHQWATISLAISRLEEAQAQLLARLALEA